MDKKVLHIFDQVRAEDELKEKTSYYLHAEMQKRKNRGRGYRRNFAVAFLFALFLFGGLSWHKMYFTPSAYIDIDVNPSIELTLNRFEKVIHASAHNDDGAVILENVSLRYANYGDAVAKLLDAMNASGYFEQDNLLSVTVQTNGNVEESSILEGLREAIDSASETCKINTVANVFAVTEEVKHCANEYHVSPAKYLAIEDLLQVDTAVDFEDCKEHSISELQQLLQEHCAEHENGNDSLEHENHFNGHENDSNEHENDSNEHENDFYKDNEHSHKQNNTHHEHGGASH